MLTWLQSLAPWAAHPGFLENALANAVGTILGGLILTTIYFLGGQKLFRLPSLGALWMLEVTTTTSKYNPYRGMVLRYKVLLLQDGHKITGTAEKVYERTVDREISYVAKQRERVSVEGAVAKEYLGRSRVQLHFLHDGQLRPSSSLFRLRCSGWGNALTLTGRFAHTAADSYGDASLTRVPLEPVVDEYRGFPLRWFTLVFAWLTFPLYRNVWLRLRTELINRRDVARLAWRGRNPHLPVAALILAEDRRFYAHAGIDPIALTRAAWATFIRRQLQGASTLEQQLVRVLLSDYRRSIRRKFKEVVLAARVRHVLPKDEIPLLYLTCVYLGWRMNGIIQASKRLAVDLTDPSLEKAAAIAARVKFPEPHHPSPARAQQIQTREQWILGQLRARSYLRF